MTLITRLNDAFTRIGTEVKKRRIVKDFSGRFVFTASDDRWVGWSNQYGAFGADWSNNNGTGAEPSVDWDQIGLPVRDGDVVKSMRFIGRTNNNEASDVDFRLYHHTADWSGAGTVDSNGEITRSAVYSQNGLAASIGAATAADMHEYEFTGDVTITGDGFLLMFVRPAVDIATNRQFRVAGEIEIERVLA